MAKSLPNLLGLRMWQSIIITHIIILSSLSNWKIELLDDVQHFPYLELYMLEVGEIIKDNRND